MIIRVSECFEDRLTRKEPPLAARLETEKEPVRSERQQFRSKPAASASVLHNRIAQRRSRQRYSSVRHDVWIPALEVAAVPDEQMAVRWTHAERDEVLRVQLKLWVRAKRLLVMYL